MTENRRHLRTVEELRLAAERILEAADSLPAVDNRLREYMLGVSGGGGGPQSKGSHSDPTGNRAGQEDKFAEALARYWALTQAVTRAAQELGRISTYALRAEIPREPEERGLAECANMHGCPTESWAEKAGRCGACYAYMRRTGRDRRGERSQAGDES